MYTSFLSQIASTSISFASDKNLSKSKAPVSKTFLLFFTTKINLSFEASIRAIGPCHAGIQYQEGRHGAFALAVPTIKNYMQDESEGDKAKYAVHKYAKKFDGQ